MDLKKVNQDLKVSGFIAIAKDLPELEKENWSLRTGDTREMLALGLISEKDCLRLRFLRNIETCIQGEVERAGKAVPLPDLETNPEYPPEFIEAKKRLAELEAPFKDLERIREALYHAGSKAYSWLIFDDPELAKKAEALAEKVYKIRLQNDGERYELRGFIERRDRVNSKVRTIRDRIWRRYELLKGSAEAMKRSELEAKYAAELAEIKEIEARIEAARESMVKALAIRFKAVLETADQALAGADPDGEPVLEDPSYQQMIHNQVQAAKARREVK